MRIQYRCSSDEDKPTNRSLINHVFPTQEFPGVPPNHLSPVSGAPSNESPPSSQSNEDQAPMTLGVLQHSRTGEDPAERITSSDNKLQTIISVESPVAVVSAATVPPYIGL